MSDSKQKKKIRTKKVAPEGGWGYFIGLGIAIPAALSLGSLGSFALLFNDLITSFGGGTSSITIITGTYFSAYSFAGLFASRLFKKFPLRNIGIFGATLFIVGSVLTIFATSVEYLIVSFGILEGAGIGMQIAVAYTNFNDYFVKRRIFVMGITQAVKGFGIMCYPIIVQLLSQQFGYRGAAAIIAAIHANALIAMLIMHPVEWHLKEVPIEDDDDGDSLLDSNKKEEEMSVTREDECRLKSINEENCDDLNDKLQIQSDDENERNKENEFQLIKHKRSRSLDPTLALDGFDPKIKRRFSSIMSLGDLIGDAIVTESFAKDGKWQKIVDFLDLDLFKDLVYVNMVLGMSLALYSDGSFFTLLPIYLFELDFTKIDAALIVSLGAAADLGSRIILAFISICIKIDARFLFLLGTIGTILFRFVFLNMSSFIEVAIVIGSLSFLRSWLYVTVPLAYADHFPERFGSAYGAFMFFQGNLTFIISPFIGAIRDLTKSYVICFHSLTLIMSLCTISWIIEMIYVRLRNRKNIVSETCN